MKENHGFIYFHETAYEHMRSKRVTHQVVLSTLQDTEQGLQSHLPTWNQMVGNITSFDALYSGKEDLTNSTI